MPHAPVLLSMTRRRWRSRRHHESPKLQRVVRNRSKLTMFAAHDMPVHKRIDIQYIVYWLSPRRQQRYQNRWFSCRLSSVAGQSPALEAAVGVNWPFHYKSTVEGLLYALREARAELTLDQNR